MEKKHRFRVEYYKQAQKYLGKLDAETRLKILLNIDIASRTLDPTLLKKLTGDIWEFRTQYNGNKYRMLAFWDKTDKMDTLVIATHGFIKKTSKVPKDEIEKAEKIMKIYFDLKK